MTREEIRSDIELRISRGKPSDDMELAPSQIDFWIDAIRAKMIRDKVLEEDSWADLGAAYGTMFDCLDITSEEVECADDCKKTRYFVTIPGKIMSLKNDMGIVSVRTPGNTSINRIRITDLDAMKYIEMAKPSDVNPVYYRVNSKLYILGPNLNYLKKGDVMALVVLARTTGAVADDDNYPISDDLVPALLDAVEAIASRQYQMSQDLSGDGVQ